MRFLITTLGCVTRSGVDLVPDKQDEKFFWIFFFLSRCCKIKVDNKFHNMNSLRASGKSAMEIILSLILSH